MMSDERKLQELAIEAQRVAVELTRAARFLAEAVSGGKGGDIDCAFCCHIDSVCGLYQRSFAEAELISLIDLDFVPADYIRKGLMEGKALVEYRKEIAKPPRGREGKRQ
jgi:hypothetical protein